jgi:GTP-binding protein HflX
VGYTNAGKSTLFNKLTGAQALAEDRLFATLDPTTRRLRMPSNQNVLLSDTVGFIRKLPHQLVEAFKATLEEVVQADILLHVVDISHAQAEEQIAAVDKVLTEIGAGEKPTLMVFNKIDLFQNGDFRCKLLEQYPHAVAVSAMTGAGFTQLLEALSALLRPVREVVELSIPYNAYPVISRLQAVAQVEHQDYEDNMARIKARIPPHLRAEFEPYILRDL